MCYELYVNCQRGSYTTTMNPSRSIAAWFAVTAALCSSYTAAFEPFRPLPPEPPIPDSNPQSARKIALGRQLFFDPRLSFTGVVSCNSCHDVMRGGDDGRAVSMGAMGQATTRNTPTLWNVAYQTAYFWDGRAASLEQAISEHMLDPSAMGVPNEGTVVARLLAVAGYRKQFSAVFNTTKAVTYDNVTKALASYIRELVTPNSDFDRYLDGDEAALSEAAQRGHREFVEAGCAACHFWVNLSGPVPGLAFEMGEGFYELFPTYRGSRYDQRYDLLGDDMGRFHVDGREKHKYLWRVPTLRNVAVTAPYFHNGSVAALDEAVRVMAKTQFNRELTDRQADDIVSFLESLTGPFPEQTVPALP